MTAHRRKKGQRPHRAHARATPRWVAGILVAVDSPAAASRFFCLSLLFCLALTFLGGFQLEFLCFFLRLRSAGGWRSVFGHRPACHQPCAIRQGRSLEVLGWRVWRLPLPANGGCAARFKRSLRHQVWRDFLWRYLSCISGCHQVTRLNSDTFVGSCESG